MDYNPLSTIDRIEKANMLTDRIIVKALQSDRGDIIRAMSIADLKLMRESVFRAVCNKLAVDMQRAYDFNSFNQGQAAVDPTAKFEPMPDVKIEEDVSAFFEIDGKLQYRKVAIESISNLKW